VKKDRPHRYSRPGEELYVSLPGINGIAIDRAVAREVIMRALNG